jgi:glycerophosphoryl diester phosphodiesterase
MKKKVLLFSAIILISGMGLFLARKTIPVKKLRETTELLFADWSHEEKTGTNIAPLSIPKFIAHACGGVGGVTYSNTLEALEANYAKGHRFFEVDINWTRDRKLVLIHDWKDSVNTFFPGQDPGHVPSLSEFLKFKMKDNLTQLSFSGLVDWLNLHPGARIVTDIKRRNLQALRKISEEFPGIAERVVPQIYTFGEYESVWNMGYRHIILTLYVKDYLDESVLKFAKKRKLFGITMWGSRGMGRLPKELGKMNIPAFAHTINSIDEKEKLEANGVSGFYTDFLCFDK